MAMMECPNCGEQVSDKAKKCVHCGVILIPEEKRYCQECGAELDAEADVCPKCGCPVENVKDSEATPQQVEVTGVKIAKKLKKIIAIAAVVILMVALIAVAVVQGQKKKEAEEAAKRIEEYSANLELVTYSMLSGAGDAETCGNLIKKVWYNAIYEERDDSTDKYTRPSGYFVSDFNDALQNLYSDSSFSLQISSIEDSQDTVNSLMKKLKNPPDEYEDAYEAITELYDAYLTLTNLATDDSRTFIVNKEIESIVEQVKSIMKKAVPYSDIFKLPSLLDAFSNSYSKLLDEMETPIEEAIDEARKRVLQELEGKLCEGQLRSRYTERFQELHEKANRCNNVATLQNIKIEADALKVRCLNEIADMESRLQAQKVAEEEKKEKRKHPQPDVIRDGGNSYGIGRADEQQSGSVLKQKKQRTISIKSINTETTWQLETEEDVKRYVADLEKKLLVQLEDDTVIHVEF